MYIQEQGHQHVVIFSNTFQNFVYFHSYFHIPDLLDTGTKDNRKKWDVTEIENDLSQSTMWLSWVFMYSQ